MPNPSPTIDFKALEVVQPIGTFYVGVMDCFDLYRISYADIRRLEDRAFEEYLGIQRPLDIGRVRELRNYVQALDASFPTGIILAINNENADYNSSTGMMTVMNSPEVAKVIDGQHRIAAFENYNGLAFQLNVVIFIDMEIEDQANVFATINLAQTKVNKSLAYDLLEYAQTRSPQKSAHDICRLLNISEKSPFFHKIKVLGIADPLRKETITQAAFVESLLIYISRNPREDRDRLKAGRSIAKASGSEDETLIFRNYFIDERDDLITRIVWNYFAAVRERWPQAWEEQERGFILLRSTGFSALMRFMRDCYLFVRPDSRAEIPSTSTFFSIFSKITLNYEDFVKERYIPGASGTTQLYRDFKRLSGL